MKKYLLILLVVVVFSIKNTYAGTPFHSLIRNDCKQNLPCFSIMFWSNLGYARSQWGSISETVGGVKHSVLLFNRDFDNFYAHKVFNDCVRPFARNCTSDDAFRADLFHMYKSGYLNTPVKFVWDKNDVCNDHLDFWSIDDCISAGGVVVADFNFVSSGFSTASIYDSFRFNYLDFVASPSEVEVQLDYDSGTLILFGVGILGFSILFIGYAKYKISKIK